MIPTDDLRLMPPRTIYWIASTQQLIVEGPPQQLVPEQAELFVFDLALQHGAWYHRDAINMAQAVSLAWEVPQATVVQHGELQVLPAITMPDPPVAELSFHGLTILYPTLTSGWPFYTDFTWRPLVHYFGYFRLVFKSREQVAATIVLRKFVFNSINEPVLADLILWLPKKSYATLDEGDGISLLLIGPLHTSIVKDINP